MPYLPNLYDGFHPYSNVGQGMSQNMAGLMNFAQRGQDFDALAKVNPQEAFDSAYNVGNGFGDTMEGLAQAGVGGKGFKKGMGIYSLAKGGALTSL